MYLKYKSVDLNYNESYINEDDVKNYFDNIIDIGKEVNIYEINVEDDFEASFIFIEKENEPDEWDQQTIDFVKRLQDNNYSVLYADEDYGENLDVIIIYNE